MASTTVIMPKIECVPADLDHPPLFTIIMISEIIVIVTAVTINPR